MYLQFDGDELLYLVYLVINRRCRVQPGYFNRVGVVFRSPSGRLRSNGLSFVHERDQSHFVTCQRAQRVTLSNFKL